MKENYRAWEIDFDEFYRQANERERLRFLVQFAMLAPSSHNSQPWRFEVLADTIRVFPEFARELRHSDADHRQLFVSLGCAIGNIYIAADYYGYQTSVRYFPRGAGARPAAELSFEKISQKPERTEAHPIFFIVKRHTNRNKYEERLPDERFLAGLKRWEAPDLRIAVVHDQKKKEVIADVVLDAAAAAMANPAFRRELSQYVKSNITRSGIGMPGFGMGIPGPVSIIMPLVLRYINVSRLARSQEEALLKKHTPLFLIISTQDDTHEHQMRAGKAFDEIAVAAEQNGIRTAPMAAVIQMGDYYKKLQHVLDTAFRPQVFCRMGYARAPMPHSPRMAVEDVITEASVSL